MKYQGVCYCCAYESLISNSYRIVTVGHQTCLAEAQFFRWPGILSAGTVLYLFAKTIFRNCNISSKCVIYKVWKVTSMWTLYCVYIYYKDAPPPTFSLDHEYEWAQTLPESSSDASAYWTILHLEVPLLCPPDSLYIVSRLDTDIHSNTCRLAFYGHVLWTATKPTYKKVTLATFLVYSVLYYGIYGINARIVSFIPNV